MFTSHVFYKYFVCYETWGPFIIDYWLFFSSGVGGATAGINSCAVGICLGSTDSTGRLAYPSSSRKKHSSFLIGYSPPGEEKAGLLTYSVSLYTLYPARAPPPGWSCVVNKTIEQILVCPTSGIYI